MSESNGAMNFDLEPTQVEVTIDGKEYTLKEAGVDGACKYRNAVMACVPGIGPDGRPTSVRNLADVEPLLVSRCLFDKNGKLVPISIINGWPARVLKSLFQKAKEISELSEDPPEKPQLAKALKRQDSPITLSELKEWADGLPEKEFGLLKKWLKEEDEAAKNEHSATTESSA